MDTGNARHQFNSPLDKNPFNEANLHLETFLSNDRKFHSVFEETREMDRIEQRENSCYHWFLRALRMEGL